MADHEETIAAVQEPVHQADDDAPPPADPVAADAAADEAIIPPAGNEADTQVDDEQGAAAAAAAAVAARLMASHGQTAQVVSLLGEQGHMLYCYVYQSMLFLIECPWGD